MGDLRNPKWIIAKGLLFLAAGILASALLLAEHASLKTAALLAVAVWCFARFYYFAFYAMQHYVDGEYRYRGLWSLVAAILRRRQ